MAAGVQAFNDQLSADPFEVGESRADGFRVAFPPLLRVSFHVNRATGRVRVLDVMRYGS